MRDFFDLNNDGKLDSFETTLKEAHMWYCIDQLEEMDDTPSAGYSYNKTPTTFDPNSPKDHFLTSVGAGGCGVGAIILGACMVQYLGGLGSIFLIGGIILVVVAVVYLVNAWMFIPYSSSSKTVQNTASNGYRSTPPTYNYVTPQTCYPSMPPVNYSSNPSTGSYYPGTGGYTDSYGYSGNSFDDELEIAGLDRFELEMMDEDERNATLEDAGLDPYDWDEF